jgi:hypothetical protein
VFARKQRFLSTAIEGFIHQSSRRDGNFEGKKGNRIVGRVMAQEKFNRCTIEKSLVEGEIQTL